MPDGAAKSLRISKRKVKFFVTEKGFISFIHAGVANLEMAAAKPW